MTHLKCREKQKSKNRTKNLRVYSIHEDAVHHFTYTIQWRSKLPTQSNQTCFGNQSSL